LSFANAGASDGDTVNYTISDGSNAETGQGVYHSSGPTLTRATVFKSTNSNALISLSGGAKVAIAPLAEDFALAQLNDVGIAEGSGINGYGLYWNNTTGLWNAVKLAKNAVIIPPLASQFTDASTYGRSSSSTALTATDTAGGLQLVDPTSDTQGFKTLMRAIPGSPSTFTFIARISTLMLHSDAANGIAIGDASGHVAAFTWNLAVGSYPPVFYDPYGSTGSFADNHYYAKIPPNVCWVKAYWETTNIHYYASADGFNWSEIYATNTLSGVGLGTPTRYGFWVSRYGGAGADTMLIPYFSSDEFPAAI
jgi:hypothetical protein